MRLDPEARGVALVFTTFFFATGVLFPYFSLWLAGRSLSPAEISYILGAPMLFRVLAAPAFGVVGDRVGSVVVVRATIAVVLVAGVGLFFADTFWPIAILSLLVYVAWQVTPIQVDAISVSLMRRKVISSYGSVRWFGSLAFVFANIVGGLILGAFGADGIVACFLLVATLTLGLSALLPRPEVSTTDVPRPPAAAAWRKPSLFVVLIAVALVQCTHMAFLSFGGLYLRSLGFSDALIGVILAAGTAAEVAMFAFGPRIGRWMKPTQLIALAGAFAVVRWGLFPFVQSPWLLLVLQSFHAATFGGTYLGLIGFVTESVEPRQVASTQGIYAAMFGGFSALITLILGQAYDVFGGTAFLISAFPPMIALGALALRHRALSRKTR